MALAQEMEELGRHIDELTFNAARLEEGEARMPSPKDLVLDRILVAVDGSEGSDAALAWAQALGKRYDAKVWVVAVMSLPEHERYFGDFVGKPYNREILDSERRTAENVVADAEMGLENHGVEADSLLAAGWPAREIVNAAKEVDADLVIVGARRGLGARMPIGSVADRVKNVSPVDVLVAKAPPGEGPVVIATDGSNASKRAAARGVHAARTLEAEAAIVHVVMTPVFGSQEEVARAFDDALADQEREWHASGVDYAIRFGDVAETLAETCRNRDARLLVLGATGLGSRPEEGLGPVVDRVSHDADVPVLIVKTPRGSNA